MRWYWFRFLREPLRVTVAADTVRAYDWRGIYGVQIGSWFLGAIKGEAAQEGGTR